MRLGAVYDIHRNMLNDRGEANPRVRRISLYISYMKVLTPPEQIFESTSYRIGQ